MFQKISLLETLSEKFLYLNLSNVALISCQHLLQSNSITLEYLFKLGLKPSNVFLLGKTYSSNTEVANHLKSLGVFVHDDSFSFNSHKSWDDQFIDYISNFVRDVSKKIEKSAAGFEKIIIVDDGGALLTYININKPFDLSKTTGIEWTSSGYRKLLTISLNFPVINVARSKAKLDLESVIIAEGVLQKITEQYPQTLKSSRKALVLGAGPLGMEIKNSLEALNKRVDIFDVEKKDISFIAYDLIIGCTGTNSIDFNILNGLQNTILVSASSSDREFPSLEIRKCFELNNNVHRDYKNINNVILNNSGFPTNFDGAIQFLKLEDIQVTLALIFTSVVISAEKDFENGIQEFSSDLDTYIRDKYLITQTKIVAEEVMKDNFEEVTRLCNDLKIKPEEIINAWVVWDTNILNYSNAIYSSTVLRCAMHLHNYVKNNWHEKRQNEVLRILEKLAPSKVVEIGFGTPQKYVTEYVLKNDVSLSLLDFDEESLEFAKRFLNIKSIAWKEKISLIKYDMDKDVLTNDFDTYIFQDSIEHAKNPSLYLSKLVVSSKKESHFIICLPIEVNKAVPEHNIFWKSKEDCLEWLKEKGLEIVEYHEIKMNSKIDVFVKYLHPNFLELLVLAKKL